MTQALLANAEFNDALNLILIRPTDGDYSAIRPILDKNTVLLQPAPEELAGNRVGLINRPGRPEGGMNYVQALTFFRHGAVAQVLGCPERFKTWQGRADRCAIHGDDCAGGITWTDGLHPVPVCWHHDNAHRKAPITELAQAADRRVLAFGLAQVAEFAGRNRASDVSVAELAWWAAAHGVHALLPKGLARTALGRQSKSLERDTGWGWRDTDARYNTQDHIADVSKMVKPIKFAVDPEPAAMHMLRPKLTPWQNEEYLKFVRSLPCVVTGSREAVEAHHVIGHGLSGMATKSNDCAAFPLSHIEHKKLHDHGWQRWEREHGSQKIHAFDTYNLAASLGVFG